ncbi:MAG: hypothetical protein R2741_13340 [Methanolobus sp.]
MNKAIRVPVSNAENIRRKLVESGKLDPERKIVVDIEEKFLEIPVLEDVEGFGNSPPAGCPVLQVNGVPFRKYF